MNARKMENKQRGGKEGGVDQEGELNMLMHVSGKLYSAVWQQRSPRHREVRRNLSQ